MYSKTGNDMKCSFERDDIKGLEKHENKAKKMMD